tara:strand:- start:1529 stop:1786 length:258 start_codon:yes stop_codon:yes gene_type:complete
MKELQDIAKRAFQLFDTYAISTWDAIERAIEESDVLVCDDMWDEIEELFSEEMELCLLDIDLETPSLLQFPSGIIQSHNPTWNQI